MAQNLNDDIYASRELLSSLPKKRFPENELNGRNVFSAVRDELMLDGNSRQNLATFCQTWVDDYARAIMDLSIDKNMIDKDEYPRLQKLKAAACTCWRICGIHLRQKPPWAVPPWVLRKRPCWVVWR